MSSSLEWKLSRSQGTSFAPMTFNQQGLLNFGQKVSLGVGMDYLSGRFSSSLHPLRGNAKSVLTRSADPNMGWLYRQRLLYLNLLIRSAEGFKVAGEGGSNILGDQLNQAYEGDEQR